jgi:transmembrane secretion effector
VPTRQDRPVAGPVSSAVDGRDPGALPGRDRALALLLRPAFRWAYVAISISELGDSFHYIALMWIALVTSGPLGVLAVRLADSVPALVFGLHGGLVADRLDRRRTMVAADVARGGARPRRRRRARAPPADLGGSSPRPSRSSRR